MEQVHKKTSNGIGHNSNILKDKSPTAEAVKTVSKEQYDKVVNSLHHFTRFARQEANRIRKKYDSAFTGYWHGHGDKLKTYEKHEERIKATDTENKFMSACTKQIAELETKARAQSIKLDTWETDQVDPEETSDDGNN